MPKFSQDASKFSPNPSKIDPKAIQKASWNWSWTIVLKRYDLEHPTSSQNAPKSGPKTTQSVPNPSQMEPKTLPNPFFKAFCGLFFPIANLPRFFIDVLLIFRNFSRAQHMKNSGFPIGKHYILQSRHFQEKLEKSSKKPPKILPKSTQILPKSIKNR